jgi:HNH endonuclease
MRSLTFQELRRFIRLDPHLRWVFTQNKTAGGKSNFEKDPKVPSRYWNGDWDKPPAQATDLVAHWSSSDGTLYVGYPSTLENEPRGNRWRFAMEDVTAYSVIAFDPASDTLIALLGNEVKGLGTICTYWPSNAKAVKKNGNAKKNTGSAFDDEVLASYLGDEDARIKRLMTAQRKPVKVLKPTYAFIRNPDVVAQVLHEAKGICALCKKNAPFIKKKDGLPYLEVHHKKLLAAGGLDVVLNAEALCPNCHRRKHHGE